MQNDETNIALVIMVTILASSSLSLWQVYKDKLPRQTVIILWGSYILPSVFTAFAAFHSFWPIPVGKTISIIGGGLLCFIGGAVCLAGIISFNSLKQSNGMETFHVVVTGIYQWTRNPQNLGWGMILLGIGLIGKSGLAIVAQSYFFS